MDTLVKQYADIQEDLSDSADEDFDNGHPIKAFGKAVLVGAIDGIFINGVIITTLSIIAIGSSICSRVRKH